jgi:hypothetical protein
MDKVQKHNSFELFWCITHHCASVFFFSYWQMNSGNACVPVDLLMELTSSPCFVMEKK